MNGTIKISIFSLLALLSLTSCGELYNITNRCTSSHINPDWDALERNLSSAEALWESQKPVNEYRYTYSASNFGGLRKVLVQVVGLSVTAIDGTGKILSTDESIYYGPIKNLFSSLRSTIVNRSSACATASITYNSSLGYPESFSFSNEKESLMDAYYGFTVTNFASSPPVPHP